MHVCSLVGVVIRLFVCLLVCFRFIIWLFPYPSCVSAPFCLSYRWRHTIDRLEERGLEPGSARRSSLKGRERAIVNQTNTGTVSKATLQKLPRDGLGRKITCLSVLIPSWTAIISLFSFSLFLFLSFFFCLSSIYLSFIFTVVFVCAALASFSQFFFFLVGWVERQIQTGVIV